MQIQNSIAVIATAIVLGYSTVISASVISSPDSHGQDSTTIASNSSTDTDISCKLSLNSSNPDRINVLVGKNIYMFVDLLSNSGCCNVVASNVTNLADIRVNYCLKIYNTSEEAYIEITSHAHINNVVGVESIAEGTSLSLQEKDGYNYQMLFEPLDCRTTGLFALAYMSPSNVTEKYYVLPSKGSEGMIQLTLHKDPVLKNKYVFKKSL